MNEEFLIPVLLIIFGFFISILIFIFLSRATNRLIRFFQLYPESQGILKITFSIITCIISVIIFLLFLRKSLDLLGLVFTVDYIENVLENIPDFLAAIVIILAGLFLSKIIKDRISAYEFKNKYLAILIFDILFQIAFVLTALFSIGVNILVFLEVYKVILLSFGIFLALAAGIPAGLMISSKLNKKTRQQKKK